MINTTCHSRIFHNLFQASLKLCLASKTHLLLARHGKLVLELMLMPKAIFLEVCRRIFFLSFVVGIFLEQKLVMVGLQETNNYFWPNEKT